MRKSIQKLGWGRRVVCFGLEQRGAALWSCRCCTCCFDVRSRWQPCGFARTSSRSPRLLYCDPSWRFFADRSTVRGWTRVTVSSLRRPASYSAERAGRSLFVRTRCLVGIASSCGDGGRTLDGNRVDPQSLTRLHREPRRTLDMPASPPAWLVTLRADDARPVPDPRKFSRGFDEVFRSEGIRIICTPFRAPQANAFAERWVGTVRRDCLDWLLIISRRQLEHVMRIYVDHYNTHRPHRALGLTPPTPRPRPHLVDAKPANQLDRRDRLGGLIHEYARAA